MQDLQPLLQLISQEMDTYQILLDLSAQKKDVLIQNDVNALNDIVMREMELVQKTRELDAQRQQIMAELAGDLEAEQGDLTLADVIDVCQEPLKHEFVDLKRELSDIVTALARNNGTNKKMIQTHLDYTNFCIHLLTDAGEGQTYDNKGNTNEEASANFRVFDQKV